MPGSLPSISWERLALCADLPVVSPGRGGKNRWIIIHNVVDYPPQPGSNPCGSHADR